nr:protein trichome birefringence-like 11 [Oryza sativa Japonica Group]
MEMASARSRPAARARQASDQIVAWAACVLVSALSLLLLVAVSSGFGAARLTGEISVLRDDDDERRPLYEPRRCPFVDEGFRCRENGRPDDAFAKWRWQPRHCTLPRFDAKNLLETLRNRRLVFVGDSIGRNQWESMLCMLATAVAFAGDGDGDKAASIYEVNGSPITKHEGALSFRFRDYNCTVEHYRSPYLVRRGRPPPRRAHRGAACSTLQLDAMDARAHRWKDADVVVFNTGHWWSRERLLQLYVTNIFFSIRPTNLVMPDAAISR